MGCHLQDQISESILNVKAEVDDLISIDVL